MDSKEEDGEENGNEKAAGDNLEIGYSSKITVLQKMYVSETDNNEFLMLVCKILFLSTVQCIERKKVLASVINQAAMFFGINKRLFTYSLIS